MQVILEPSGGAKSEDFAREIIELHDAGITKLKLLVTEGCNTNFWIRVFELLYDYKPDALASVSLTGGAISLVYLQEEKIKNYLIEIQNKAYEKL